MASVDPAFRTRTAPFSIRQKVALTFRIWASFVAILFQLRRHRTIPEIVASVEDKVPDEEQLINPRRIGRVVYRVLSIGSLRPRCLHTSLVLYKVLRREGYEPQLLVGLPQNPKDKDAHAWVEVDGIDVGPPPGRGTHIELARYG